MDEIRQLSEGELASFARIVAFAYPGIGLHSEEDIERFAQRLAWLAEDPALHFWGLFRDGALLGAMRLHDFTMNLLGTRAAVGGVGLVGVDFAHKQEHVARDLIAFFLRRCRDAGLPLATLYPFRPDFYKVMGFGYGTKMSRYRARPASLPGGGARERVGFLGRADKAAVRACYDRYLSRTHGMIERGERGFERMFDYAESRIVGYREGEEIHGYLRFSFVPARADNYLLNDLQVGELLYETPAALAGLLAFLRSQADQIGWVQFDLQDDSFHHLLLDPRNGTDNLLLPVYHESNTQGVGLMYRVLDVPRLFQVLGARDFSGQTLRLKLTIADTFLPENAGGTVIAFDGGRPRVATGDDGAYDVELRLGVADFSSLVMGAVDFASLHRYGLAALSDPTYADQLNALFRVARHPQCVVEF